MKRMKLELFSDGSVNVGNRVLNFDNEKGGLEVEVLYPKSYIDWDKVVEIVYGDTTTYKTNIFTLSQAKKGEVRIQPTAILGDRVVKWDIVSIRVKEALNVLDDNEVIEESVVREILEHTNNFREELGISNELTWQQLIDFIKGV